MGATSIATVPAGRPWALLDTRIIYCGDNLEQLAKLPDGCVDLIYIDPPFNSDRNYEVFWTERSEPLTPVSGPISQFDDPHASTQAYIDYMRPVAAATQQLARVLKPTGSFYYHCDWHAKPPKRGRSFTTGIPPKAAGYPWHATRPSASHRGHVSDGGGVVKPL